MTLLKTHISLNTPRFKESVEFYKTFFNTEPVKLRGGYAKFDISNPPLNLALNESNSSGNSSLNHLGIQVETSDEVWQAKARLEIAGLASVEERDTDCCYALQDKIWVTDPYGYKWEIFTVKIADTGITANQSLTCCDESCCG